MIEYKTSVEMAALWNVSPRHVQYLCKNNIIEGAAKRVGAWFIPADTPSPVRNTKADSKKFKFVGTKKKIFENATHLYMQRGFENVSMKDIADTVGIKQSAMYNHFSSKQEILDTIYDYFCYHYLVDRPTFEAQEVIMREGSLHDIIRSVHYEFSDEYMYMMSDMVKIIFQRSSVDEKARDINKSIILEEGISYVEQIFGRAVEIGRLAPFDVHTLSVLINSVRLLTMLNWVLDPSEQNMKQVLSDEQNIYDYATMYITDLKETAD